MPESLDLDAWLSRVADPEEAAALTALLVSFRSYPGEELAVQQAIATWLGDQGVDADPQETGAQTRPNVIATIENGSGPTLLLNGHTDTVLAVEGWDSDPWQPRRDGDRLYGLGACDMKSGVAAAMLATRALAQARDRWRGTLIFSAVVDEEAYSIGARALIDAGIRADACLVTEASWRPCLGSIGKVLARVEVTGKAGHASWPDSGINAAIEGARLLARLDEVNIPAHPRMTGTQTVLSYHSGSEQYVITIPERATAIINRMIVPGETSETVRAQLETLAAALDSPARFEVAIDPPFYPPWETPVDHPFVGLFTSAYQREIGEAPTWEYAGFGDANLFSTEAGIPTIQFGPRGSDFHQANEWVDIPSIAACTRVILRTALSLMPA